jgi:hypothetical protein
LNPEHLDLAGKHLSQRVGKHDATSLAGSCHRTWSEIGWLVSSYSNVQPDNIRECNCIFHLQKAEHKYLNSLLTLDPEIFNACTEYAARRPYWHIDDDRGKSAIARKIGLAYVCRIIAHNI